MSHLEDARNFLAPHISRPIPSDSEIQARILLCVAQILDRIDPPEKKLTNLPEKYLNRISEHLGFEKGPE